MKEYLESVLPGFTIDSSDESYYPVTDRKNGKKFKMSDHIRGLIYAQLSNQRKWSYVEPHLDEIDKIFFEYDIDKIKQHPGEYFNKKISAIKCSNRGFSRAMEGLNDNLATFENLQKKYGSVDKFVTSKPAYEIVELLSQSGSEYKLKMVGEALAWEYLRNVGIDGAKPDVHMRRFLGADRMGTGSHSPASTEEVYNQVKDLSETTGISMTSIDTIIWCYCADDYGEICTASPNCQDCVIRTKCSYN